MNCKWLKVTQNVQKGIQILNKLEDSKFEPFLKRIGTKLRLQEIEIFTEEEKKKLQVIFKVDEDTLMIAIKTLIYLHKRLLKFIFMPVNLHKDLINVGFETEKAEYIVKLWSSEVSSTLNDLVCNSLDKVGDNQTFSWKLNTELSSDIQKKSKIPKAYLSISNNKTEQDMELTHSDLYTMFIQFEAIQNELDSSVL
ncbi:COMM domain-containing protein 10 [Papilio machaon]|uniref:COMM domain-containing protein 10 n=1 Tax=Papilio machaon TaxID=76193 RepID=A0A194RE80_PAPMA|nr:COMM domain-containing protein 10 [Papilio machaon]